MIKWGFFILNIDLFLIYKDTFRGASSAKYRIYQLPELRLESNSFDRLRAKCNIVTRVAYIYLPLKFMFTAMQTVFDRLNPDSRPIELDLGIYSKYIAYLLGRPLATIPGASIFIYTGVGITLLYGYILCPMSCLHKPIRLTTMRLFFDPNREIRRIDIMIADYLKDFMSIESNSNQENTSKFNQRRATGGIALSIPDRTPSTQSTLGLAQFNHMSELRPATYTEEYFVKAHHLALMVVLFVSFGGLVDSFVLPLVVTPIARERNCLKKSIPLAVCSLKDAFNAQEIVALVEVTMGVSAGLAIFFAQTVMVVINLFFQLTLASSVEADLSKCLKVVRNFRGDLELRNSMCKFGVNSTTRCDMSFTDSYHGQMSAISPIHRRFRAARDLTRQVETTLLRTLVKLVISEREIKESAQASAKFVEAILLSMGVSLIGAFIGMKVDGEQMRVFRNIALLFIWWATNSVLLGCAYVFSQTIKVEKVAWSILAHLKAEEIKISSDRLIYAMSLGRGAFDETLVDQWTKLVTSYGLSDARNSVRPFGLSITYGRTLRINFLALSLASLILLF